MELFQRQVTLVKDRCLKKQINFKGIAFLFIVIFFSKNLNSQELNSKINVYLEELLSFSSKFIQSNYEILAYRLCITCNEQRRYLPAVPALFPVT